MTVTVSMAPEKPIVAVPTNIITGFLGAGKTSAILHLLNHKPTHERWAVLVNEFGEIGIDGCLFASQHPQDQGVFIREVPGGCMCCAAGLPMQIALNQLLMRAKPDRLLIEPTGLGHPKEVLQVLSTAHYQHLLLLQKIVTVVDARTLSDQRYTQHETFQQQIAIADVVLGNKQDLYTQADKDQLLAYMRRHGPAHAMIHLTNYGAIARSLLNGPTANQAMQAPVHRHQHQPLLDSAEPPIPACGFIKAMNEGEGFTSMGWRFASTQVFNHQRLRLFFSGLQAERMKAVCITDAGIFAYNLTQDTLSELALDECIESRIEMIAERIDADWDTHLMRCLL